MDFRMRSVISDSSSSASRQPLDHLGGRGRTGAKAALNRQDIDATARAQLGAVKAAISRWRVPVEHHILDAKLPRDIKQLVIVFT